MPDEPQGGPPKPAPKPAAPAKPAAPPKPPTEMVTTPWEGELPQQLKEQFGAQVLQCSTYLGQNFLAAVPEAVIPIVEFLKYEADFDYLVDITAVDYPQKPERFEVVYILYSFARNERIRMKTRVKDGQELLSATSVHLTADWLEREIFDMFGIRFAEHPNMTRILMPEGWTGHPLRKDYGILNVDQRWVQENLGIESAQ